MQCIAAPIWLYLCKPLLETLGVKSWLLQHSLPSFLAKMWYFVALCCFGSNASSNCSTFMLSILITFVPSNGFTEGLVMSERTVISQAWSVWVLGQVPPAVPEVSSAKQEIRDSHSQSLLCTGSTAAHRVASSFKSF